MTFLLDVNVLIALIDPTHVSHNAAHSWFEREGRSHWSTCPLTENGVIRVVGHPKYPNTPGSPAGSFDTFKALRAMSSGPTRQVCWTPNTWMLRGF